MVTSIFVVLLFFLLVPFYVPAVETTEYGAVSDTCATAAQEAFDASGIPSAQAALIINDTLYWAKGFGNQPTLDTVFRTGSITKTLTAAAFVKLYENGTIDLDDDVSDYLPFQVRNTYSPGTIITIRMILEHKAGMAGSYQFGQPWFDPTVRQILQDNGIPGDLPDVPEWNGIRLPLREIINSTNINNPDAWKDTLGTKSYSNSGYFFLSFLLEHITNDTWSKYIHDNILSPLGMSDTVFNITETSNPVAIPHEKLSNGSLLQLPVYRDYGYGAGGLITTVSDMAKFLIAVLNDGVYGEAQVFLPENAAIMKQFLQPSGSMVGYSAGFSVYEIEGGKFGTIQFTNWGSGASSLLSNTLKNEAFRILGPPTTDTPPITPTTPSTTIPDTSELFLFGALSIAGIVVVLVVVILLKKR